jgi:adenosylcobyric acid synthase
MLGQAIYDPLGAESDQPEVRGLGLLSVTTTFAAEKQTVRAGGVILADCGLFTQACGLNVTGYEIHMGRTVAQAAEQPLHRVRVRGEQAVEEFDGAVSADGLVAGTYFHGWFENDALRGALLASLAARTGGVRLGTGAHFDRDKEYDRLAAVVRDHLDMAAVYQLLDIRRPAG